MRNVSDAFKAALLDDDREYILSADIVLADGTELFIDDDENDIWENGFKLEDSVSGGSDFQVGSAIIGKFTLILNNLYEKYSQYDFFGAEISPRLTLPEGADGTKYDIIRFGKYTVDESQDDGSLITLTCLDNMSKFDKPYSESTLEYPASLFQILEDCCSHCDVELVTTTFDNMHTVVNSKPESDAITFREVVQWISQIACAWATCDDNGRLRLSWCRQNLLESENPDESLFHTISEISSVTLSTDDVVVTGMKLTYEETVPDESGEGTQTQVKEILKGKTGYVLSLEGNGLIQQENAETIAESLEKKIVGLRFRPFNVSHLNDPTIEPGDICKIINYGKEYMSIITSTTFSVGEYQTTSCDAETPSRNSATQYSAATKTYVEMRKMVQKEKTDRELAVENLNKMLAESSGMYITVDVQPDGSSIYYMHNKPTLKESDIVWKLTAEAFGISTDGGKTYPYGFTVDGELIARILQTEGVNADWINTGNITARDADGNITFSVNMDTGEIYLGMRQINDIISNVKVGSVNLLKGSKNLVYPGHFFAEGVLTYKEQFLIRSNHKLAY